MHRAVKDFISCNPHWFVVRHEDLCYQPVEIFQEMFDYLGLCITSKVTTRITGFTSGNNADAQDNLTHYFYRNSTSLARYWEGKLTGQEIKELRDITESEMLEFYSSW